MIFKKKESFLLIFLILLQSCSGGRIGNFLEASFENLEKINEAEKKSSKLLDKKKVFNSKKGGGIKKNIEEIKSEKNFKNVLDNKKNLKLEKKSDNIKKTNRAKNFSKRRKNELQSYKIIFILKDVDPKDPIEELSTILRNSDVNFEIEKIERFFDENNKTIENN